MTGDVRGVRVGVPRAFVTEGVDDEVRVAFEASLDALKNDEVVRGAIGEFTFEKFYEAKISEWNKYRISVSQWELDNYLAKY